MTESLDPADWVALRAQGHRMLDDMLDYIEHVRARPLWQPIPEEIRASLREPLPAGPSDLAEVYGQFKRAILPYATGNTHPGFMGWVHGGGNPAGMLGEMLAAGLNANLGGRDHMPIEVERQIARWMAELFGFPESASGLFVTGTSMANLLGVLVARTNALGVASRSAGVEGRRLTAYTSKAAHGCIAQAMEMAGLGSAALRVIPTNEFHQIDLTALKLAIAIDRHDGATPFLLVGNAGTVDIGAIDDLVQLADLARCEQMWFHVDGAFGALAMLAPDLKPRLAGIEQADSIALDFHKWGQVPYDAGFFLAYDGEKHRETFAAPAAYLRREARGLGGGSPWPCEFGPDLSRGFRALKTWFTLKVHGAERIGATISETCAIARHLEACVKARAELELMAPVQLNIVCFRYRGPDADALNAKIVADLHEGGVVAPSTTVLDGGLAIRAAIVNHRTERRDVEALVESVVAHGNAEAVHSRAA
jgi:aromatic-L-amino-acid/L-tryptophan decarboxylase